MTNLIQDISTLTTLPEKTLNKLNKKALYCICESVIEDKLADEDISEIFIGIGTLYIKHDVVAGIKYHFEPSDTLAKSVMQCVSTDINPLENSLNDAIAKKFKDIYKDLC